eukprot:TRINITY_DN938_c0_g1_i1.p1 TRINITY_DN938_c0_g1~~TRINITY_DN938_c0_g1_i1.p1  ORF type:complete len:571 (-),score=131.73 TRINITY_DN938_c0_g1_i1:672-2384(-)
MDSYILDLIEKIIEWIRSLKKKQHYVNPDLDPVLLVPGIAGSILQAVDENGNKERIWVRILAANHEFKDKLWSIYNPATGKTESLNPDTHIEVPEDRYGLYACDILDPDLIIDAEAVYYFHDLIEQMLCWGYDEGTTLFGFGYDFRQSNRLEETFKRLIKKLESIYETSGGKKINVITHSMGGILMKCFVALHKEVFEKYVSNWIGVAVPFQGAPGYITDALLDGVSFCTGWEKNLFVSKWAFHQLVVECPSVYELMGNPDFDWSSEPLLQIWRQKEDENGDSFVELESFGLKSSVAIMKAALANNTATYNGKTVPLPFNNEIYNWSNETREILSSAKLPSSVNFYNVYGVQFDTPFSVCYGSEENPIVNLEEILDCEAVYSCVDGDGTVPLESAKADGFEAVERISVEADHRDIVCDEHFFNIIKSWLNIGDPDPLYDRVSDYVILPTEAEIAKFKEKVHASVSDNWEVISNRDDDDVEVVVKDDLIGGSEVGERDSLREQANICIDVKPSWSIIENHIEASRTEVRNDTNAQTTHVSLDNAILEDSVALASGNQKVVGLNNMVTVKAS